MSIIDRLRLYLSEENTDTDDGYTIEEIDGSENIEYEMKPLPRHNLTNKVKDKETLIAGEVTALEGDEDDDESDKEPVTTIEPFAGEWVRDKIIQQQDSDDPEIELGWYADKIGRPKTTSIPLSDFSQHSFLAGQTGTGKSTMLINMIVQFILYQQNAIFVTPKEDDIVKVLASMPPDEIEKTDVIAPNMSNEYSVGLNPFSVNVERGTAEFDTVVDRRVTTILAMLLSEDSGGALINNLTKTLSRELTEAEEEYSMIEFIDVILSQEARDELTNEPEIGKYGYTKRIEQLDSDDLDSTQRRANKFEEQSVLKNTFFKRKEEINFEDYVEGDRNLLVNLEHLQESDRAVYAIYIVRGLWNAAQKRANHTPESQRDLVGLFIDEFDDIIHDENYEQTNIREIFDKARSYRLGLVTATQFPDKIPRDVLDEIQGNVKNKISLRVEKGEREMANSFNLPQGANANKYEITPDRITGLSDYTSFVQPENDKVPQKINNFARVPPYRSEPDALNLLHKLHQRTGSETPDDPSVGLETNISRELSLIGKERGDVSSSSEDEAWIIARAVDVAQRYYAYHNNEYTHANGDKAESAPIDLVEKVVGAMNIEYGYNDLDAFIEENGLYFSISKNYGGSIGLTNEGESLANKQISGDSGSSGKIVHRGMLQTTRKELAKHGIIMTVPSQDTDGDMPDGVAYLFDNHSSLKETLFPQSNKLYVEIEKSTKSKPAQTVKNLGKNSNGSEIVAFVMEENAGKWLHKKFLQDQGYNYLKSDGFARLHTTNSVISGVGSEGDRYAVYPSNKTAVWVRNRDGNYELRYKENEETLLELSEQELLTDSWSVTQFPAYIYKQGGDYYVQKPDGTTENVGSRKRDIDDWTQVYKPLVPNSYFENGIQKDDFEAFEIVNDKLRYYNGSKTISLTEVASTETQSDSTDEDILDKLKDI